MLDQIPEQLACPADAAFEEREAQFREAPGEAAEKIAFVVAWPAAAKWPMWL